MAYIYNCEPEHSCPEIDRNIEILDDAKDGLRSALEMLDTRAHNPIGNALDELIGPLDEGLDVVFLSVHNTVGAALSLLGEDQYDGMEEGFEYCRSQCENIRSWGHEWREEVARMTDQENRVEELEGEVEHLENLVADHESTIDELKERIDELEEELRERKTA